MHIKRSETPKTWPIPRKGGTSKYILVSSHAQQKGISMLFIMRDLLKIAKTRKEIKRILLGKDVRINGKVRKDESFPVQVFDVVSFGASGKNYRLDIINGKFKLKEVSVAESGKKIVKIRGKVLLGGKKVQMNLEDGQNFLVKDKFSVGDSAVVGFKDNKVEKVLALKEGANIEVIGGKHIGEKGKVVGFKKLAKGKMILTKLKHGEVELPPHVVMVTE
ncbi:MAG: S4 domain-containing protein [archaeon]